MIQTQNGLPREMVLRFGDPLKSPKKNRRMKTLITLCLSLFLSLGFWNAGYATAPISPVSAETTLMDPDSLARIIKRLCGKWEHAIRAADIFVAEGLCETREQARTASLRYAFRPDGTFSKGLFCAELGVDLVAEGRWQLSSDGRAIILERFDGETRFEEILPLYHLDVDELIIGQPLNFHRALSTDAMSELYFNKI